MHEEADTGIFVNARHAMDEGSKVIVVKASDTNVLVIAVSVLPSFQKIGLQQLWIAFGQGRDLRWISVHDLYLSIGSQTSRGLLFFHAFTGCDVVSAFRGKERRPLGKPGSYVTRLVISLSNSASTQQSLILMT